MEADYSIGEQFAYGYDEVGNMVVITETITSTVATTYTYNAANQLETAHASEDGVTWYYTYDQRGNLVRQTPGGTNPAEGETRYTYNAARQLVRVELYTDGDYTTLAEGNYNADGKRVRLTTYAAGAPLTVTYGVFQEELLVADNGTQTTRYLSRRSLIAEHEDEWAYHLRDGEGSVRQSAGESGAITLARAYKPFGGILEEQGLYETAFGFLGAQLDRSSGLLYAGGRYYDPATGRFLMPERAFDPCNPRTLNPYAPLQNPALWLLAPLAVIATFKGGKKRRKYGYWLLLLLVVGVGTSVILTGCDPTPTPPLPTEPPTLPPTPTPTSTPTPTPPPPSDWFSREYGKAIARRARELVSLSSSAEIEVLRDMTQCWDIEQLQQVTQYVCADVVLVAYFAAGINLQQLLLTSTVSENWQYPECAAHNAQAFGQYLQATGQLRGEDDFPYYQGEIVIGYPDWAHAAVVVEGGYDENRVRLVQASYGLMKIEETTLFSWKWREYGPQDYVWHGHPSAEELERISP